MGVPAIVSMSMSFEGLFMAITITMSMNPHVCWYITSINMVKSIYLMGYIRYDVCVYIYIHNIDHFKMGYLIVSIHLITEVPGTALWAHFGMPCGISHRQLVKNWGGGCLDIHQAIRFLAQLCLWL